jgi:hypothetical protein
VAGALLVTYGTAGAGIVIEFIAIALAQFDNGIFGAGAKTSFAFKTVATA